jgi:hypothetical protein
MPTRRRILQAAASLAAPLVLRDQATHGQTAHVLSADVPQIRSVSISAPLPISRI